MAPMKRHTGDWLKRKINAAKAEKGLKWSQIADKLSSGGKAVSASSLMSKHSRASFTAVELVSLLQLLDVHALEMPRNPQAQVREKAAAQGRSTSRRARSA